jgi:hypothetical protein
MYGLKRDPYGTCEKPGILHRLTLHGTEPGKDPFEFTTFMYIPLDMDPTQRALSLQLFDDEGQTALKKKFSEWRGRDVKKLSFLV